MTVDIKCRAGRSSVQTLRIELSWPHSGNGSGSSSALPSFLRSSSFNLKSFDTARGSFIPH